LLSSMRSQSKLDHTSADAGKNTGWRQQPSCIAAR